MSEVYSNYGNEPFGPFSEGNDKQFWHQRCQKLWMVSIIIATKSKTFFESFQRLSSLCWHTPRSHYFKGTCCSYRARLFDAAVNQSMNRKAYHSHTFSLSVRFPHSELMITVEASEITFVCYYLFRVGEKYVLPETGNIWVQYCYYLTHFRHTESSNYITLYSVSICSWIWELMNAESCLF